MRRGSRERVPQGRAAVSSASGVGAGASSMAREASGWNAGSAQTERAQPHDAHNLLWRNLT